MSIQLLDSNFLATRFPDIQRGLTSNGLTYLLPHQAESQVEEQTERYIPNDDDDRDSIPRQIKARRGQRKFRNNLRKRYGDQCMVTSCEILDILEAAHINPYKGIKDNNPENGLLLLSDIHTLYDLDLIGIHPVYLTVHVHDSVKTDGYQSYHLQSLKGCTVAVAPNEEALRKIWHRFSTRT